MRVDELRPLPIFDGLSDGQLAELASGGAEVRIEPGVDLFREGEHADDWWVLVDGAIDLVRRVGREDTVVARMDVPGRWAGGFRAWDEHGVYLATGRGATAGRVLRVPAEVLRERSTAWFPFGGHLIQGLYRTARSIESTARQRESLVTLGTLAAGLAHEINNPASAATRAVDALQAACATLVSSLGRLAGGELSAGQFAALEGLRHELEPRAADPDPLARADREQALSSWLARHGVPGAWTIAPPLAAAGVDPAWCARAAAVLEGPALAAWPGVGGGHALGRHPAGRGEGVDPPHLRAGRRGQVLLPAGPLVAPAGRRDRRPRQHAGDAGAQAPRRRDGAARVRRRRPPDRGLRRRAQPGLDQPDRQRGRRHGRHGHAAAGHAGRGGQRRRRGRRHRPGDGAGGGGPRLRGLLHHQGRRQGHRARPRHRPAHRRGAPRRRDRHRLPAGRDRAAGPHPRSAASTGS